MTIAGVTRLPGPGAAPRRRPREASGVAGLLARPQADYHLLLALTALLLGIGMVMVLSASSVKALTDSHAASAFGVFRLQVFWAGLGVPAFFVASRLPLRFYRWAGYPLLLGALGLLLVVLVPGVGRSVNGAVRWINLGPAQLQPSEFAKIGLVLWGADLLARKHRYGLLTDPKHLLIPLLPVGGLIVLLIMMEPDLGTTMTVLVVLLTLLWVAGAPLRYFASLLGVIIGGVVLLALAAPYRLARLTSFTDPFHDSSTTGYQAVQGFFALSSGHFWGVGLGASREKWTYLPNAHTDYIFAVIGEELGLLGTLLVVSLYAALAVVGLRIARRAAADFGRLVAAAVTAWLVGQAVLNMGYVVGMLPVTGVPLPLISVGGTALVISLSALGILAAVARDSCAQPGPARGARDRMRRLLTPRPRPVPVSPRARLAPPRGSHLGASRRPSGERAPTGRGWPRRPHRP